MWTNVCKRRMSESNNVKYYKDLYNLWQMFPYRDCQIYMPVFIFDLVAFLNLLNVLNIKA